MSKTVSIILRIAAVVFAVAAAATFLILYWDRVYGSIQTVSQTAREKIKSVRPSEYDDFDDVD